MTLTIAHGNGHNEMSLVQWLAATPWDSAGANEAQRLIDRLRQEIPDARLIVTDAEYDRAQETPVLVRNRHRILRPSITKKVSNALGEPGTPLNRVAPARTLTGVFYAHPLARRLGMLGFCHLNLHPDAGPAQLFGNNPFNPIVREYRRAWRHTRRAYRDARAEGYLPFITGDFQMGARATQSWAPAAQAAALGSKLWMTEIDGVIFPPQLVLAAPPSLHKLFDHTGFLATFAARH